MQDEAVFLIVSFNWTFVIFGCLAALFVGISKGGFGSGAGFAATPLLAVALPPELAVAIIAPLLLVIDAAALKAYWRRWSWPETRRLIFGCLPGVALGAAFWTMIDSNLLRLTIGLLALSFVAFQGASKFGWIGRGRVFRTNGAGLALGLFSGFTGFVAHAGGPAAAVYLLARGLDKTTYQASTVLLFAVMNVLKAVVYAAMGIFSLQSLTASAALAPAALCGAVIGVMAHRAIPERPFFAVTYALLTILGAKLILDSV